MNTHADKPHENKTQPVSLITPLLQPNGESAFQFVDNRPETVAQRKLQEEANGSAQVKQLRAFQEMTNSSFQPKQGTQLQAMENAHAAQQHPLIQKKKDSDYNVQTGKGPIQRTISVGGELWVTEQDMEGSPLNNAGELASILESIGGIEYLADPPANIQAAINDERIFHMWKDGEYYDADVTNYLVNQGEPADVQHLEVNTAPDIVVRGELAQTMRIAGLISCVAVIIEAGNDDGTQQLIGMHFTTGYHTAADGSLNARGTNALQAMTLLVDGNNITRVHLCHPMQINGQPQPATLTNLQNLQGHFGAGICQTHILGQTHVTARLGTDGAVTIDV